MGLLATPSLREDQNVINGTTRRIHWTRRSPEYWRVTFDRPPLNIFGPETIPQLNEIVTALESDDRVKVVVFDSAVDGYFLNHSDFLDPYTSDGGTSFGRITGANDPRIGQLSLKPVFMTNCRSYSCSFA